MGRVCGRRRCARLGLLRGAAGLTVRCRVTEEACIRWMVEAIEAKPGVTTEELMKGLQEAGMTPRESSIAFNMTNIAWGRMVLGALGVTLANWYTCFDGNGEIIEQGPMEGNAQFAAAMRVAPEYQGRPAFQILAMYAHDVKQLHGLLEQGYGPEKLGLPPLYIVTEAPSEEGLRRAQAHMESQKEADGRRVDDAARAVGNLPALPEAPVVKRPWWKLW